MRLAPRKPVRILLLSFLLFGAAELLLAARRKPERRDPPPQGWKLPAIRIPKGLGHPRIACTQAELDRLRRAWQSRGAGHAAVAAVIRRANAALKKPLEFPPRGGQHNQWYQCDKCQAPLKTLDAHHHQCPICKKIYSGPPYDDVVFSRIHQRNLRAMADAAWAWAVTGRPKYAKFARRVLIGYADRYRKYPFHGNSKNPVWNRLSGGHLFEQTLTEASAMAARIAPAYDLIYDSPVLSAPDRARIRDGLFLPMLHNIDRYKAGVSNWQTWHNAAMFCAGAVIDRPEWMRKAVMGGRLGLTERIVSRLANIEADRLNRVGNSFLFQMQHSVTADGMWFEGSWGYHFYALSALVITAEAARRLGIDLWHYPGFEKMFTLPLEYAMPDGTLPRFGDDVHTTIRGRDALFEPAYAAFHDPILLTALPAHPTWFTVLYGRNPALRARPETLGSVVFHSAGHAILRTRGSAGLVSAMTFGPYGGFHGHLDKLSFVFFAFGHELGVDPGRARSQAYRLPIHRHWYKATISHNTVLVDFRSQRGVAGKLLGFAATPAFAAVAASTTKAYPGVKMERILAQAPEYLLVFDRITSGKRHRYTWAYHNRGIRRACNIPDLHKIRLRPRAFPGARYLRDTLAGRPPADKPLHLRFETGNIAVHLEIAPAPDAEALTGTGVGASVTDRVPLVLVTRKARNTVFAAVLAPVEPKTAPPPIAGIRVLPSPKKNAWSVRIRRTGGGLDTLELSQQPARLIWRRDGESVLTVPIDPARSGKK